MNQNLILIILGVAIFVATLLYDLYTDIKLWKEDKPVKHTKGTILRCIGLIPAIILIGWPSIMLVGFAYWLLFDGLFNTRRGFNWWFTGSDDPDDAKMDNLLQTLTLLQHKALKIGGLGIGLILYLIINF